MLLKRVAGGLFIKIDFSFAFNIPFSVYICYVLERLLRDLKRSILALSCCYLSKLFDNLVAQGVLGCKIGN